MSKQSETYWFQNTIIVPADHCLNEGTDSDSLVQISAIRLVHEVRSEVITPDVYCYVGSYGRWPSSAILQTYLPLKYVNEPLFFFQRKESHKNKTQTNINFWQKCILPFIYKYKFCNITMKSFSIQTYRMWNISKQKLFFCNN